jgi:hypothetical protein
MKSPLGLNNSVRNSLDPFHREPKFKVTGYRFQVCLVSETELQAVKGNISQRRCKECVHRMRKNFGIWCIWMDFDGYSLRRVFWRQSDVSEEHITSIFRVEE